MADTSPTGTVDGESLRTVQGDRDGGAEDSRASHPSSIGRFRILRVLGAGGMGFVYVGRDEQLRRDVAIKVLRAERDSERARQRLEREAHALAQLSHPNVVPVFEVGEHDGRRFIAMELVEGDNLRAWLRRGGHTWRDIIDVFVQAARGLAAAHARGLVHRDFKPENALISDDGEGTPARVRVVDFGVVAESDAPTNEPTVPVVWSDDELHTRTGEFLGTPRYMAPEQFAGVGVGPQADQFAWCVALYEALASARPFIGASASELATAVTTKRAEPLPPGAYPRAMADVLARGLLRDPNERFATMNELIAAVQAAITVRRRRWPWIVGGVALVATVVVVVIANRPPEVVEQAAPAPAAGLAPPELPERAKEPLQLGFAALERGEPQLSLRWFDEAVIPFERAQEHGGDMAQIQYYRGMAYLAAWKRSYMADHLIIAHELLRRTAANEYEHPQPDELQALAKAELAKLEADASSLTAARGTADPGRRYLLLSTNMYPEGTVVTMPERIACTVPCTLPLPVDDHTTLHFTHPGFTDVLLVARPQDHMHGMLPLQPMRRLRPGETWEPASLDYVKKMAPN